GAVGFVATLVSIDQSSTEIFGAPAQIVLLCQTILLAPLVGYTLNIPHSFGNVWIFRVWNNWVLYRAIMNNDFELLMLRSVQRDRPVMFTMEDGKVYVGWVIRAPNPVESRK